MRPLEVQKLALGPSGVDYGRMEGWVRRWARAVLLLATGGVMALGGVFCRHLTYGDVYAIVDHARQGKADALKQEIVAQAETAVEAEKTALLDEVEAAAGQLVDEAAARLKDRVDEAAGDAKADLREKLRGQAEGREVAPPIGPIGGATPGPPSTP